MTKRKLSKSKRLIAWVVSLCLIITLIPDIGYATDDMTGEASAVQDAVSQPFAECSETEQELMLESATDPAMDGLSEEDVIEKTETTTTYDIGEGKKAKVIHGGQVRFENEQGELTDYDPSLVKITTDEVSENDHDLDGYRFTNKTGDKKQYLPKRLSEATPVLMEYEDYQLTLVPTDETVRRLRLESRSASVQEEVVPSTYEGEGESLPVNAVYGDSDDAAIFTYTSGDAGIKETLILNERPETNIFTYEFFAGDLLVRENMADEGITIIDPENDDIVAGIEAPWMNDATGDAFSTDISYDLEKVDENGRYMITMIIDEDYLYDEDRVYPVTVDPTVTWKGNDMIRDTYVITGSGYANTNFYDTSITKMPVGKNSTGAHRSLFKILNLKAEIEGKSVDSAKLTLYESGTGASGQTVRANRLIEDWSPSTVTWNEQPEWNTSAYTDQVTTSGTKNTAKVFDCTGFARNVSLGTSNYGLILRNITSTQGYACFWGSRYATTSYRPKLVVTYYDRPTTYTSASTCDSAGVNTKYFPAGKAIYASWSGVTAYKVSAIQYRFTAAGNGASVPTAAAGSVDLTTYRSIGSTAKSATAVKVPYSSYLPVGTYRLYMRTKDAADNVSTAKYVTLNVDGGAPIIDSVTVSPSTGTSSYTTDTTPEISWELTEKFMKEVDIIVTNGGSTLYSKTIATTTATGTHTIPSGKLKDGTNVIKLIFRDQRNNETAKSINYYVDTTAPVITSLTTEPAGTGSEYAASLTPVVKWTVTESNFSKITVTANGKQIGNSTSKSGSMSIPSGTIPGSGTYDIKAVAYDKAGNSVTKTIKYNVDVTAPVISSFTVSPATAASSPNSDRTPSLSWKVTDSELKTIEVYVNGSKAKTPAVTDTSCTLSSGTFSAAGTYDIMLKAIDDNGYSSTETVKYHLDFTAPVFSGLSIEPKTTLLRRSGNLSPKISWNISETNPDKVYYSMDQKVWSSMGTAATGTFNIPQSAWSGGDGTYTVYFKAVDKAGNVSAIRSLKYHLDTEGADYTPQDMSVTEYYGKNIITWDLDGYDDESFRYDLHRGTTAGFMTADSTCIAEDFDASEKIYIDNEILGAGTYYYKIKVSEKSTEEKDSVCSGEVSIANKVTLDDFVNTLGTKAYLSYTTVELPTGTAYVEESSGNLMYEQTDFEISNPQLEYGMYRTYNSGLEMTSMTGKGWMDSYHKELYRSGEDIYMLESDGSIYRFTDGQCSETKDYVMAETDEGYTVTTKEEVVYTFNAYGQLTETSEPNGCRVVNTYDELGRLVKVISPASDTAAEKSIDLGYEENTYHLNRVRDLSSTEYLYDVNDGILEAVTVKSSSTGEEVSYCYDHDTEGHLSVIYDGEENPYTFTYTSDKVTKAEYPDNESLVFEYGTGFTGISKYSASDVKIFDEKTTYDTASGKILTHEDAEGVETRYGYFTDRPFLVETETTTTGYEEISEGVVQIKEKIHTITYTYDDSDNLTTETETDGTVTEFDYKNGTDLVESETVTENGTLVSEEHYQYDDAGNLESSYDAVEEAQEFYLYDEDGNETDSIEFDGVEEEDTVEYSGVNELRENVDGTELLYTDSDYDDSGNIESMTTESADISSTVTSGHDAMGREISSTENGVTTATEYDFLGRAVKVSVSEDGKDTIMTTNSYDMNGTLISESIAGGVSRTYEYDSRNRNISETITGSDIQSRTRSTVFGSEQAVTIKDGRSGRTEDFCYTETIKDTDGDIISVTYIDNAGNTVKTVADGMTTYYTYDKAGNQVVTYSETSGNDEKKIDMQLYDIDGNNIANISQPKVTGSDYVIDEADSIVTYSTFDEKGNVKAETDGEGIITEYGYDDENRLAMYDIAPPEIKPEGYRNDLDVTYGVSDGNTVTTISDGNGNQKTETVNEAGLTISTVDIGQTENENISVDYIYDALGRKDTETYADNSYIDYDYEGQSGRISKRTAYDSSGTMESTAEYFYDGQGRLAEVICKDSSDTEYCRIGYAYDCEGKLLSEITEYAGQAPKTVYYSYDNEGRLSSRTYPDDTELDTLNYIYDAQGRCISVKKGTDIVREYSYDGFGRIAAIKDYDRPGSVSSVVTAYGYDDHGRAISMITTDGQNSSDILESFAYVYDKNDLIVSMTHVNDLPEDDKKIDETRNYVYDDHGRLIRSTKTDHLANDANTVTTYEYDEVGNRVKMIEAGTETGYTYNCLNQLLTVTSEDTTITYTYDKRGNQTEEKAVTTVNIDGEASTTEETVTTEYFITGELKSLTRTKDGAATLMQSNQYDHNGQRIIRTQDGSTRCYYYDDGVVAFTEDGSDISSANILSDAGTVIGSYRGDIYHNYLTDMQGSTTNIIKEDGMLTAAYDYADFGETKEITGGDFDNQICYTGGIYDEETGLYYLNARYYDPETGRFISQDSYRGELDDPGQWHLYAYCANNPINYVDPSGHKYRWATTVYLHGPELDYFYRMGYLEHKKRNGRKPKIRIGIAGRERYVINYFNLGVKYKNKCKKYKEALNNCNSHFKKIQKLVIDAIINITASVLLQRMNSPELAEAYKEDYDEKIHDAAIEADKWYDDYNILKKRYKEIKKKGRLY